MLTKLQLLVCKVNFAYPNLLGPGYNNYSKRRIKNNYLHFNQTPELIATVNEAIQTTQFYKDKYSNLKINSIDDFESNIDFIDKELIMDDWQQFISDSNKNLSRIKSVIGTTGGTSGKPLKLVLPRNRYIFELATMHSMWKQAGWDGHTRGIIRNHRLKDNEDFKINFLKKEIIFDGFRNNKEYFYLIYNTLKYHNIKFIHAYPSSAYQFSTFMLREQLDTSFISSFLCGSEGLLPEQIDLIKNQLGINIYHWYGHSEKLILGGYCENSDLIHIEPTYGYFELIDDQGKKITNPGETGEMVGTTLHNNYMPLIRYKTGDYAEYAGNYCSYCKRKLTLLKIIHGRWDNNKIFKSDGSFITTTALNLHSNLYSKILGIQYVQNTKGHLKVLLIKNKNFNNEFHNQFMEHFTKRFEHPNVVEIEYVNNLIKLPNGKFNNLISECN